MAGNLTMKDRLGAKIQRSSLSTEGVKLFRRCRKKVLRTSLAKLKKIPDAEQCLRRAVLIRNTYICANNLTKFPKCNGAPQDNMTKDSIQGEGKKHNDLNL